MSSEHKSDSRTLGTFPAINFSTVKEDPTRATIELRGLLKDPQSKEETRVFNDVVFSRVNRVMGNIKDELTIDVGNITSILEIPEAKHQVPAEEAQEMAIVDRFRIKSPRIAKKRVVNTLQDEMPQGKVKNALRDIYQELVDPQLKMVETEDSEKHLRWRISPQIEGNKIKYELSIKNTAPPPIDKRIAVLHDIRNGNAILTHANSFNLRSGPSIEIARIRPDEVNKWRITTELGARVDSNPRTHVRLTRAETYSFANEFHLDGELGRIVKVYRPIDNSAPYHIVVTAKDTDRLVLLSLDRDYYMEIFAKKTHFVDIIAREYIQDQQNLLKSKISAVLNPENVSADIQARIPAEVMATLRQLGWTETSFLLKGIENILEFNPPPPESLKQTLRNYYQALQNENLLRRFVTNFRLCGPIKNENAWWQWEVINGKLEIRLISMEKPIIYSSSGSL